MINLDFSNVQSREPLAEGTYGFTVKEAKEKTSQTGNQMIALALSVFDMDREVTVWDNLVITKKCMWRIADFLDAVGLDHNDMSQLDVSTLVGLQGTAKIIQEEYNGNIQNRVKRYMYS